MSKYISESIPEEETYVRISKRFFIFLQSGVLSADEFLVLTWLMFQANCHNGIATTSYAGLANELTLGVKDPKGKAGKIMNGLKEKRCIWFGKHQGCRKSLRVAIDNYFLYNERIKRIAPLFEQESVISEQYKGAKLRAKLTELLLDLEGTSYEPTIYKKKLDSEKTVEDEAANSLIEDGVSRSAKKKTDNEKGNKIKNNDSLNSIPANEENPISYYGKAGKDVIAFQPRTDNEQRCKEMALWLEEPSMHYILSKLRQCKNDMDKIEEAYLLTEDAYSNLPESAKTDFKAGRYFNKVLEASLKPKQKPRVISINS